MQCPHVWHLQVLPALSARAGFQARDTPLLNLDPVRYRGVQSLVTGNLQNKQQQLVKNRNKSETRMLVL